MANVAVARLAALLKHYAAQNGSLAIYKSAAGEVRSSASRELGPGTYRERKCAEKYNK